MKPKTIEEHLKSLEEPYRARALKNMDKELKHIPEGYPDDALIRAFHWEASPEGMKYWSKYHDELLTKRHKSKTNQDE